MTALADLTLPELTRTRQALDAELAASRARLAAIAVERQKAKQARDANGDRLLVWEAEDLEREIAQLEEQRPGLVEREQAAAEAALAKRQAARRAECDAGVAGLTGLLTQTLVDAAGVAGRLRLACERLAELEPDRDRAAQVVAARCQGAFVAAFGETLGFLLSHDPRVSWPDVTIFDRVTNASPQRIARDTFFAARGLP